jgi:digeranylgeranylglycerophospholipid reductase
MKSDYDVIVIGAGPAGSVAAMTAAGHGLDVLLIEKRQEIGEPVRCAEGIQKFGLSDFIEPDSKWICAEIKKGRVYAPDGTVLSFIQTSDTAGYILDRKIFDRALAKKAANAGAQIAVKTQATSLIKEYGVITGIDGIHRGNKFQARSKVVIGADGVESKVGRWAGLMGPLKLKDMESCAEFTVSDIDIDPECCELYFGNSISPGGYVWVFPKGERTANVGLGILGTRLDGTPPVEYLKRYMDSRFPEGKIIQTMVGAVPLCDRKGPISTGGLMLAGDGARLVDPLFGAGIMNAMLSGRMAGNNAAYAIQNADVTARALKRYDDEIRERIGKAIHRNYLVKEIMVKTSDRRMNTIIHGLKQVNIENARIDQLFNSIMTSGISLRQMMHVISFKA